MPTTVEKWFCTFPKSKVCAKETVPMEFKGGSLSQEECEKTCDFISQLPDLLLYRIGEIDPYSAILLSATSQYLKGTKSFLSKVINLAEEAHTIKEFVSGQEKPFDDEKILDMLIRKLRYNKAIYAIPFLLQTLDDHNLNLDLVNNEKQKIFISLLLENARLNGQEIPSGLLNVLEENTIVVLINVPGIEVQKLLWKFLADLISNDYRFGYTKIGPIPNEVDIKELLDVYAQKLESTKNNPDFDYDMAFIEILQQLMQYLSIYFREIYVNIYPHFSKLIAKNLKILYNRRI